MQPAFSVIFLTTLAGAAQGLFLALYGTELSGLGALSAAESRQFLSTASLVALVLTGMGLLASFFHLGHPERAWRTATMWRTSWLSREVIALPLFMLGLFLYVAAHWFGVGNTQLIGAVTVVLCLALFVAMAMVYASVRFLQEWASPLTLVNYLLLGCASGLTLATLLAAGTGMSTLVTPYAIAAAVLTLLAWVTRSASLMRNARLKPKSTLQSAIGIKHPRIVQKAQGFMGGSFNTREFFHGRSTQLLRSVKWAFLLLVFPLPLLCLALGVSSASTALLFLAFALQYLGLLAERWFFFAQANHPQNLYYQTIS
ncbi:MULTISPECIES: DmsC/YnfH family molybdoenzyme membrane anchor subunit [Comamonadaceae]|uniref:dimethyl sulfoxide reductase anchor subunit family protein n=1 Tax=Comamonadaceae TaxID=80864 RepID=UPI0027220722|nr:MULTISPECIES: DmsC/YnfH family molybdoenzyme membrane anchor subunit [Comamonadaceae]MDO9143968.1 DmsC/YnfH family molybdoenzyme membrane anchor subunit [Rhodoferax sp.]MDP3190129.1 DmsC/YnfH family molybdoenzyme membrane anchor subunit [Rhodoferax sp.]MDP3337344.1 DmsC/YnfH family molybdoenzyme membrane anchor subunit [Rhodoferax sp.]MDP3885878.1 DmsC/YnfH family molybdoenzyme membrane anchor subunit [Hydrogenophaga sp.]